MMSFLSCRRFWSFVVLWLSLNFSVLATEPIRGIQAVRDLSVEKAESEPPLEVEVEGQVTLIGYSRTGCFISDGEHAIYVSYYISRMPDWMKLGSVVKINGQADPGGFLPHVNATSTTLARQGSLSEAPEFDDSLLFEPGLDCERVRVKGILLGVSAYENRPYLFLTVMSKSRTLLVRAIKEGDTEAKLRRLIHRRGEATVVVATRANEDRQMTDRYFQLVSIEHLKALVPGPEEIMPFNQVLKKGNPDQGVAMVRGRVIHSRGDQLYLRREEGCVLLRQPFERHSEIGSRVRAEGYIVTKPFGPELLSYSVKSIGRVGEVKPVDFPVEKEVYSSRLHNELVVLNCELLSVGRSTDSTILNCMAGGVSFEAIVPVGVVLSENVSPGCEMRLAGICRLESNEPIPSAALGAAERFKIHVRKVTDISVIKSAPWWTMKKLLVGIGVISLVGLFAVLWGLILRRRVKAQTQIISEQSQREATMKERQRLARELHDSLQQNLTGISFQVDHAQNQMGEPGKGAEILERVQGMITECQKETRESITRLRSSSNPRGSLVVYLEDTLREQAEAAGVEIELTTEGDPVPLDSFVLRHSLKICQEAFSNALRHAEAEKVVLSFKYRPDELVVSIVDDGKGFRADEAPVPGHYGIVGMRERAELIGAKLNIKTEPGEGSEVELVILASRFGKLEV